MRLLYYQSGSMSSKEREILEIILGQRLKELRAEKKLTPKEVAEYLRISSVTYLRYEKAQREPSLELLAELAIFFGVSTDYLLGLKEY